jgi:hypothetical protein
VSPAAGAFVALRMQLSSFLSLLLRAAARACWRARSHGGEPAGPPALAAVVVVSAARRGGGRTKPCAAPPIRRWGSMTPRRRRAVVSSVFLCPPHQRCCWHCWHCRVITSSRRCVVIIVVASPHNLHCHHYPCLRHHGSRCCCRQCRGCSPPLMVGCCVAYSVVCRPICHPPLLSSCDRQHFRRRPPAAIPYHQLLPVAVLSIIFTTPVDG